MHFAKIAHKVAKSNILSISEKNLSLWKIHFSMIYSLLGSV